MRSHPEIFIDRKEEVQLLKKAINERRSLLISGPAGAGKTMLTLKVISELPEMLRKNCLYVSGMKGLQDLLKQIVHLLFDLDDPALRSRLRREGAPPVTFKKWLEAQPSTRLRGALYQSAAEGQYWLFLDHLPPLTHSASRVVKELIRMRATPVYLLARGFSEREIGHVTDIYWGDPHQLAVGALANASARELVEDCIHRFGLSELDLQDFRKEVLHLSGCLPGAIVQMCALAAQPQYQYGSQIKLKLLHIDYLMSGQKPASASQERSWQAPGIDG